MYRKILVPLDGSAVAEKALDTAVELARLTGAELILFRALVLPSYHFAIPGAFPVNMTELVDGERSAAEGYLDRLQAIHSEQGLNVRVSLSEGKAAAAILEAAETEDVDLLVLASHGQGGLERWVYGSVADRVLRKCKRNLLLVRSR